MTMALQVARFGGPAVSGWVRSAGSKEDAGEAGEDVPGVDVAADGACRHSGLWMVAVSLDGSP
jgi:hypothetical protein